MRAIQRSSVMAVFSIVTAVASTACRSEMTLPNYNDPTADGLSRDPAGLQLAATGILVSERGNYFAYIRDVSIFGREAYYYFPTDSRFVTDYFVGAGGKLSSTGFASGNFFGYYRNQRNAVNLVKLAEGSSLSAAQKAAVRGYANTFRALDLYYVISTRDSLGSPTEIQDNPNEQSPYVSRDSTYRAISGLLESAKTDLVAAGATAFPFQLTAGFAGFDTPATFLQFNRAIAARVYAMRGSLECGDACYTQALTAVAQSFASAPGGAASQADLDRGTYNLYSSAPGDSLNALSATVDVNFLAHASIVADVQSKPDGSPDARLTRKVAPLDAPRTAPGGQGIASTEGFTVYGSATTPTPIIRNEELLLIRAEANLKLGNIGPALVDLNNVRAVSGGLAPITTPTLDALLYERRYSLLIEGFRWIDMRRFGRLAALPLDLPTHFVAKVMPIPKAECDARSTPAPGC